MQYPWPKWKRDDNWEPSVKIISKRRATKAELAEDQKKRNSERAEDLENLIAETKHQRTVYSETLNRKATPYEVAYVDFVEQCAVADFNDVKRPSPPSIIKKRNTKEKMSSD